MVEFLLLVLPMIGLAGATLGVTLFAFASAQLQQVAAESALALAQPDSNSAEVYDSAAIKLGRRLGVRTFSFSSSKTDSDATVSLELAQWHFLGPLNLVLPELSAVSHAQVEA